MRRDLGTRGHVSDGQATHLPDVPQDILGTALDCYIAARLGSGSDVVMLEEQQAMGEPMNRPPNVVLFISDQQRADTMPGMRRVPVETPHLDWLAAQGTVFQNAYCASPICAPARTALLTGLFPHTTGMIANYEGHELALPQDVLTLADYLKPLGYACAYTGKWHLGTGADRRGFTDHVSRSGDHDVDDPSQNDFLRFLRGGGAGCTFALSGADRYARFR